MIGNGLLGASLLALKHRYEQKWLKINAVRLLIWSKDVSDSLQKGFSIYLFERSKLKNNEILEIMEALPSGTRRKIKSTADYFREEGWKKYLKETN